MSRRLVDANEIIGMPGCGLELQDRINEMPELWTDDEIDGGWVKHEIHAIRKYHDNKDGRRNIGYWTCSHCGHVLIGTGDYCPYCGAKMDKKEKNDKG